MADFNLLPTELAPRSSIIKLVKILKRISIISFSLFIILAALGIGTFITLNSQLKTQADEQAQLKVSVKALEETEQKLVLVQDRLAKANIVLGLANSEEDIINFKETIGKIPAGIDIRNVEIENKKTEINLSVKSTTELEELIKSLIDVGLYKNIEMSALSFNETGGFSLKLTMIKG